ncbi:hypothetical protein B0J14DRAFT_215762 [Halenospora varia]|nr:hypothetical protein B0J14DRAFT_215762 [Halenospora varia]
MAIMDYSRRILGNCCSYLGYALLFTFCCPCIVLFGVTMKGGHMCGNGRRQQRMRDEWEENWKERKKNEPRRLPKRRTSLSIAAPSSIFRMPKWLNKKTGETSKNKAIGFLDLPRELREQIYNECFGYSLVHLTQLPKRLGHTKCNHKPDHIRPGVYSNHFHDHLRECIPPVRNPYYNFMNAGGEEFLVRHYHGIEPVDWNGHSDGGVAILQTCRQVYNEAIDVLYTTNTFDVNHPQTLIFLERTIRPIRLASIQNLQITWHIPPGYSNVPIRCPDDLATWTAMWVIAGTKMTGLQRLKLNMEVVSNVDWRFMYRVDFHGLIRNMLEEPICKMRGLIEIGLDVAIGGSNPYGGYVDVELLRESLKVTLADSGGVNGRKAIPES